MVDAWKAIFARRNNRRNSCSCSTTRRRRCLRQIGLHPRTCRRTRGIETLDKSSAGDELCPMIRRNPRRESLLRGHCVSSMPKTFRCEFRHIRRIGQQGNHRPECQSALSYANVTQPHLEYLGRLRTKRLCRLWLKPSISIVSPETRLSGGKPDLRKWKNRPLPKKYRPNTAGVGDDCNHLLKSVESSPKKQNLIQR